MTSQLKQVVFTGLDEKTDFQRLREMYQLDPRMRFSVMVNGKKVAQNAGRAKISMLYPPNPYGLLANSGLPPRALVAHLQGNDAIDFVQMPTAFKNVVRYLSRIHIQQEPTVLSAGLAARAARQLGIEVSLHTKCNPVPWYAGVTLLSLSLVPTKPKGWGTPDSLYHSTDLLGYSGGITPDNLPSVLPAIQEARGTGAFWIELGEGIRVGDCFDADEVEAAMVAIRNWERGI